MNSLTKTQIADFENQMERFLPNHSIDCVILGYENQQLKVLLLQWKMNRAWCLPGGFVFEDEDMIMRPTEYCRKERAWTSYF